MKEDHSSKDGKLSVVMVVNGNPYPFEFALGRPLQSIVKETLEKTGNAGQPSDNWEVRDDKANLLDLSKHLRDFGFSDGVKLFLNPKVSIGGIL